MAGSKPSLATDVHVWQARLEPGAARGALRGVLSGYLDEDPAAIELRSGERGKPMLADPEAALRFNLSHSGGLVLIAVCWDREVGVDVQRMRRRRGHGRPVEFFTEWTRREAIAKCHGVGLWAPLPDAPVAVCELAIESGYAAAVAVSGEEMPAIRRFEWPLDVRPSVSPAELAVVPGGGA
jgi:4'-phosphopantetheinyl transferase